MYLSKETYKKPLDENAWYAQKRLIGKKYYYYLFRKIHGKKEMLYAGNLDDVDKVEKLIRDHEKKLKLPPDLKTKFKNFILIEVEPDPKIKSRKPVDPGKTKWYGRVIKNGGSYPIYMFRKIDRKTHRFYLGTDPTENEIKEKISAYETKINLEEKHRTKLEKYKLKIEKE